MLYLKYKDGPGCNLGGIYDSDIHNLDRIPKPNIVITEEERGNIVREPSSWRVEDGQLRRIKPKYDPDNIYVKDDEDRQRKIHLALKANFEHDGVTYARQNLDLCLLLFLASRNTETELRVYAGGEWTYKTVDRALAQELADALDLFRTETIRANQS